MDDMQQEMMGESKKGLSITSFVLAILALILPFLGILCGIAAIIFGIVALTKKQGLKGLAIAGIIIGVISFVVQFIMIVAIMAIYFKPSELVAGSTFVTAPFFVTETRINANSIDLEVKNNGGESIDVIGYSVIVKNPSGVVCAPAQVNVNLPAGGTTVLVTGACNGIDLGDSVSADVTITYIKQGSSIQQISTGALAGQAS